MALNELSSEKGGVFGLDTDRLNKNGKKVKSPLKKPGKATKGGVPVRRIVNSNSSPIKSQERASKRYSVMGPVMTHHES